MMFTSGAIKAMTAEFNRDDPGSAAPIADGEAIVRVSCGIADNSLGRVIRAVVRVGVRAPGGRFIDGCDPEPHDFRRADGREHNAANARRVMRHRWSGVHVPVEYQDCQRPAAMIRDKTA